MSQPKQVETRADLCALAQGGMAVMQSLHAWAIECLRRFPSSVEIKREEVGKDPLARACIEWTGGPVTLTPTAQAIEFAAMASMAGWLLINLGEINTPTGDTAVLFLRGDLLSDLAVEAAKVGVVLGKAEDLHRLAGQA